ncbi:MAG: glycoside hydrolase family 2 protein [Gemmatimonadota bacterium]|nr:MAG: glycoside hydrolase family 2 protein [Gemmatimonadota bacterium]
MKKSLHVYILVTVVLLFCSARIFSDSPRTIEKINSDWKFHKGDIEKGFHIVLDDTQWEPVDIPHTWNAQDPYDHRDVDDGLDITVSYYRGPSWYRKSIRFDNNDRSNRISLVFEGANKVAEVWMNETKVGTHIGGCSGFEFDITSYVRFGEENLIAVRVDNSYHYDIPPQSADYTMYGGIYRDVYVVKTASVYLGHSLISTPSVTHDAAKVKIEVPVTNKRGVEFRGDLEISLLNPVGTVIQETLKEVRISKGSPRDIRIEMNEIEKPQFWSPDTPHLYTVRIRLREKDEIIDEISERFGLRWFRFDPNDGFFLNGEYMRLKGVNRHQDRAGYGNAVPNHLHTEDMHFIKSMGANFVRLAHYQQDQAVLYACDSLGLLVWEEIPVVRSVGKEKFSQNAKNMLREMITQHSNHPCIIIWGLMNEVMRDQRDEELHWAVDLCRELNTIAKDLDPSRYTAQAQFKDRGTDVLTITDITGFNKYYGWYSDTFDKLGPYLDEQKELFPDKVFIISEYGAGSDRGYHVENPTAPDFTENWQLKLHQSYWKQITERRYIAGSAVWNMFDFGSWEKGGTIPHINQKGLMSFDRKPKDIFYFYQSLWTEDPMVYIVSHTWRKRYGTKGQTKDVEVFSNCDQVELYVNGASVGLKTSRPYLWDVNFSKGVNHIKAVGKKEDSIVEDEISISYFIMD